jgi:CHAD domain-containing protein
VNVCYHFAAVTRMDEFQFLLDSSWKKLSATWKKARISATEKSIHDLRVSTRRLMAILELVQDLSKRNDIHQVRRTFKKVLKGMGPLRDVQVQLENVSHMKQVDLLGAFRRSLKRRERREIEKIRNVLKRGRRRRLRVAVKVVRSELNRLNESLGDDQIRGSVERVLALRRNEFLKAEQQFRRLQPDEQALHEMRIAFKKLRYIVEAAQPVIGPSARKRARKMQGFQQLMGDSRDVAMLHAELEKWAKKEGRIIAIVPTLHRLEEKQESLLSRVVKSSNQLEKTLQAETPQPIAETTQVVVCTVPAGPVRV